jgi:hypothetical protein
VAEEEAHRSSLPSEEAAGRLQAEGEGPSNMQPRTGPARHMQKARPAVSSDWLAERQSSAEGGGSESRPRWAEGADRQGKEPLKRTKRRTAAAAAQGGEAVAADAEDWEGEEGSRSRRH